MCRLDIICGTSVGAINGCGLAAFADAPRSRARRLVAQWQSLRMDDVVRLKPLHLAKFVRTLVAPRHWQPKSKRTAAGGSSSRRGWKKSSATRSHLSESPNTCGRVCCKR